MMSCYFDNGTGWCDGQRKGRGGLYRICWGCPKLASKKKEKRVREDPEKVGLLEEWDQIVGRLKRSGFNLSEICITLKE